MRFREYQRADKQACLALFVGNTPDFFAPHEEQEFSEFLDELDCSYFVLEDEGAIVACGGYYVNAETGNAGFCWGMVERVLHRKGLGRFLLLARLQRICEDGRASRVRLETSQHSSPFFARFGFVTTNVTQDGFAPGLDTVAMVLELDAERCKIVKEEVENFSSHNLE